MSLARLGCKTMRDGITVSAIFLIAALTLLLAGRYLVPDIASMPLIAQILGLILLLLAPMILLATYVRTLSK